MRNTYKIADKMIAIDSLHNSVHKLCAEYLCEGEPDITVSISPSDIDEERAGAADDMKNKYSDGYLESLAVYRKIAEEMLRFDTVLFHGSAVAVDGEAYLFTAKSGTGKSTHTRLWCKLFGERAVMVNDDKPLIRISGGKATVYGTPWNGKHRLGNNISMPLKAICVLERDSQNHIEGSDKRTLLPMMIQQTYRPRKPHDMIKMLSLVERLSDSVCLYRLGCNMDIDAAETAYNGMKNT